MGIEVQHGGVGGTTAGQIIAQAGQANLERQHQDIQLSQKLKQQRDMQMTQIEAQSDLQKQAADDAMARTALKHGLDGQIREQEFDNTLTKMQEQARIQANQWEYQWTGKQRQEIAKYNNSRQMIKDSDNWSPEEKTSALRAIDLKQANIKPSMMPRDPSKPQYPEGRGIGDAWTDDSGTTLARTKDGDLKLMVRPDQTREYHAEKLKAERENKMLELKMKLATESVDEVGADGAVTGSRHRTPEEINALVGAITGQQAPQQQQPQQREPKEWWEKAGQLGVKVKDSDKRLPPMVGAAQAYFREYTNKYGSREQMPKDKLAAYDEVVQILMQYAQSK